jgi:hypothetical protein
MRRRENKRREVPSARTRRRFLAVLVAACLFVAIAAAAQQPPCTPRTIPVSVATQAGQPVTGLTAANFTAKFDGRPLLISSVTAPKSPPTVLILLDVSNSMRYFPGGLEGELRLAELLVLRLPSDIPAGLALLRERVVLAAAPKTDRNSFNQAIERIRADSKVTKARGATALWDALLAALNLSGQLGAGDVIYVVTDGVDNSSHATMVQAQQAALGAGVRIFAALLGQRGFERKYASPFERDMSDTSGGGSVLMGRLCGGALSHWMAASSVPRTHLETGCLLAFAAASILLMASAFRRTCRTRSFASFFGRRGRPSFLGFCFTVSEILYDSGSNGCQR